MPTDSPLDRPGHDAGPVVALSALAALVCGAGSAVQARANGALATAFGAPVEASLWSFGSGWLVLVVGLVALPRARAGLRRVVAAVRAAHLQWWELLGGLAGGFFVGVQTFAVPQLGVALFTIALVGGQTTNALLVDHLGLGPAGRTHVTAGRVAAALVTFVGVAVATTARSGSGHALSLPAVVLAVLAGAGMAVQQAINGKVNGTSRDPVATTFINFSWGLLALTGWACALAVRGGLHAPTTLDVPWWAWLGGVIGVAYIAASAVVVRHLGVLVTALMTLTGQLVTAVLLDLLSGSAPVSAQLVAGVAITLAAAAGAGIAARRPRRTSITTEGSSS